MKKDNVVEIEAMESEEMETEKVTFLTKAKTFAKANGKKILTGVGVVAVGLLGYAVGKGASGTDFDYDDEELELEGDPDSEENPQES